MTQAVRLTGSRRAAPRRTLHAVTTDPRSAKVPATGFPLDARIAARWSPRGFDQSHELSRDDIGSLLEAARWSASASNAQPWRFIVTVRGSDDFMRVTGSLQGANAEWAPRASALIVACALTVDAQGRSLRWAAYDLGQSVAWLTAQAESMGLSVHQMGGFDPEAIARDFDLAADIEPMSVVAIGRFDAEAGLSEQLLVREAAPRERLPLDDLVLRGWPIA